MIIVDPGAEGDRVVEYVNDQDASPTAIVLTHAHFDHIGAVDALHNAFNLPVYLHATEHEWLTDANKNGSKALKAEEITVKTKPLAISPGENTVGGFSFEVLHTPGHSPGSISLVFDDFVIGGDTLFYLGIGRTDLYGGNTGQLKNTIENTLYRLPDQMTVYPGHGPTTTIGYEKKHNPFVRL